ncbi:MAG: rod shape-determining protein RodA [Thermoactinospora sp.]|nr:rod shape-determining protein RodA [Thermoactinospora sp.]
MIVPGLAVALSGTGLLLVWSATRTQPDQSLLVRQAVAVGLGLALMWLVSRLDLRVLRAYVPLVYAIAVGSLIGVLTPLGVRVNGQHSWIVLAPGVQFQPAEFAKLALVLALAMPLGELREGERRPGLGAVLTALVLAAIPMALIVLQPDPGTLIVFCAILAGVILVSGARLRWLAVLAFGAAATVVAAWQAGLVRPHHVERLMVLVDPASYASGIGYNAAQARIAIGSGGLAGKGLFNGEQTAGHFVPEQHTDFIFTVAGEELGFAGGAAIVVLLGVLLWRGVGIAARSGSPYGKVVAGGVVCWLAAQSFVNVGMTLGLLPIIGVPLPLVSYGGSSTVACLVAVGLLEAVRRGRASAWARDLE